MADTSEKWLIVGLGNPGTEYAGTRHNAGFMAADLVAQEIRANYWKNECGSIVASKEWEGREIVIAKPQSFMNLSGVPVSQLVKKHKIPLEHLIVMHDDLDIPAGTIRVKDGGSHGGHNGLKSIFEKLGGQDFLRIKIGIGRPPGRMPVVDYVLQRPRGDQEQEFLAAVQEASEAALYLIQNGIEQTQARFNRKA